MPYDNMNVQYRGKRGSMHAWYVYESGMTAQAYESMSPVGPNVLGVMFDGRSECWTCDCAPNDLQPSVMGQICDHVYKVCKLLVGAKGPWEQDAELMQRAWDAVRPRVRREDDLKSNYEKIARFMSTQMSAQAFSALTDGTFAGMDTSTTAGEYKTARVSYDENKGVQFTIDGEDVTKDIKTAKIRKSYADGGVVSVTLNGMPYKGKVSDLSDDEVVTVTLNGMPYKGKVSGLKADKLIVDEFNEHKEPEPPKKRKSRFTEIDL